MRRAQRSMHGHMVLAPRPIVRVLARWHYALADQRGAGREAAA